MNRIRNKSGVLLYSNLTEKVIGLSYQIHQQYGCGQKEIVYQNALAEKLSIQKIKFEREVPISIKSEDTGKRLGSQRMDFTVNNQVIVELKAMKFLPKKLEQQLYSYLRNSPYQVGLMINFGTPKVFVRRVILTHPAISRF